MAHKAFAKAYKTSQNQKAAATPKKSSRHEFFKLGKKPARRGAVKFKLATYLVKPELPKPPKVFGHQGMIGSSWGMFGNDTVGDCVWAGAAHETMLWNKEAMRTVTFNDKNVLKDYSKVTGFDPSDPDHTDNGTDMQEAASYRRKTGVLDAKGKRHKVLAYLALRVGDVDQLALSMYLFSAVGIGFKFPDSAMAQFNAGKPWDVVAGPEPKEGHYVPGFGRDKDGNIVVVTWGRIQLMTPKFYKKYCDEAIAYVSSEMLVPPGNTSLEGLNVDQLLKDLNAI
jgi:hypothetical protein